MHDHLSSRLTEKIEILTLVQDDETGDIAWAQSRNCWASVELDTRRNIFSVVGVGTRGATVVIRPDNKCILLVAFSDFFTSLEAQNVVQSGTSGAELDAEAIREFLLTEAEEAGNTAEVSRIKALSDDALRKEDTGSHVFLHLYGHVLDAMEDFHITLEAQ